MHTRTHLALAKQGDGLAQRPQHLPHFAIVRRHDGRTDLAPQLKLLQQRLLLLALALAGLWGLGFRVQGQQGRAGCWCRAAGKEAWECEACGHAVQGCESRVNWEQDAVVRVERLLQCFKAWDGYYIYARSWLLVQGDLDDGEDNRVCTICGVTTGDGCKSCSGTQSGAARMRSACIGMARNAQNCNQEL